MALAGGGPAPASAVLAASLFATERQRKHARRSIGTGCWALDRDALDEGFDYGRVTALSGGPGSGKSVVSNMCF